MGLTARAGAAARFLFVSSAFVTKWGLNKMAYAGQGERLHVISVCVCVCVNRIDTVDCWQLLSFELQ